MEGDYRPKTYVVFRRMDSHAIAGVSARMVATVAALALAGLMLFALTGQVTSPGERKMSATERAEAKAALETEWYALHYALNMDAAQKGDTFSKAGAEDMRKGALSGLSDEEVSSAAAAGVRDGITAGMALVEVGGLVPEYVEDELPVVPDAERLAFCMVPALIAGCLLFESQGASLASEIAQFRRARKGVRTYEYKGGR